MMTKCRRRGKFAVLAGPIELLSVVRDLAQPLIRGKAPSQIRDAQQCARKVGQNRGRPNTICPVQYCPKFLAAVIPIRKFSAPPFAILGFSAVIFYGLRRYLDYDKISREPWGELYWQDLREVPLTGLRRNNEGTEKSRSANFLAW